MVGGGVGGCCLQTTRYFLHRSKIPALKDAYFSAVVSVSQRNNTLKSQFIHVPQATAEEIFKRLHAIVFSFCSVSKH